MRLDDRDRGRILLAVVITLIALPVIWLVNRDEDGPGAARPNVAAAGIDPGEADAADSGSTDIAEAPTGFDPMGNGGAAYLESKPTTAPPAVPEVAIGTTPGDFVGNAAATYRASDISPGVCEYNGTRIGEDITVTNVANGRSIQCTVAYRVEGAADALVMHTNQFRQLADLISAPIHVEVRR